MNKTATVLLSDDSRFFRAIETKFLQKTPARVIEAEDYASTMAAIRQEQPELVYMAFSLLPEGGASCCAAIKNDPLLCHVPVVMICDQDAPEQPELAMRNGADATLCKPLDRHDFLQIGRKFLSAIREHRQPSFFPLSFSSNNETFAGKCLDISGGGIFIESRAEIAVGAEIELSFKLPDTVSTQIKCSATVSWLNRKPNPMKPHYPHGFGAKFNALPDTVHRAIVRLNSKRASG